MKKVILLLAILCVFVSGCTARYDRKESVDSVTPAAVIDATQEDVKSAAFFETSDYYCPWGKGLSFSKSGESFFTPLNNLGISIGHWFAWLVRKSDYPYKSKGARYAPSIAHWRQAVNGYGGYKEYGVMILDELVYRGISRKRLKKDGSKDKVHDQPLLP